MVRRGFAQIVAQELPKAQRIGGAPRNPAFRIDALKVARQQHPEVRPRRQRWSAGEIRDEITDLATVTRRVALPFLTTPMGDWDGLRALIDEKIRNAPKPWVGLFKDGTTSGDKQRGRK